MAKFKLRRGTKVAAATNNVVLEDGEPGYEKDTGKLKIGNGALAWNSLPYINVTPAELAAATAIDQWSLANGGGKFDTSNLWAGGLYTAPGWATEDNTQAHAGPDSLKLVGGGTATATFAAIEVSPGDRLFISLWGKKTSDYNGVVGTERLALSLTDGGAVVASVPYDSLKLSSTGWTMLTGNYTVPPGAPGTLFASLGHSPFTGSVWLDDLVIVRVPAGSPLTVTPQLFGAVGDGIVDDTGAINAAASYIGNTEETLVLPKAQYRTTGQLNIQCALDAHDATILADHSFPAVRIGVSGSNTSDRRYLCPRVIAYARPVTGWDGGSYGIHAVNLNACEIHVPHSEGFEHGLLLNAVSGKCSNNEVHLGTLQDNRRNVTLLASNGTDEVYNNVFLGGKLKQDVGVHGSTNDDANANMILLDGTNAEISGNTFIGTDLSGNCSAYYKVVCNRASDNKFINLRWGSTNPTENRVYFKSTSKNNEIDGGQGVDTVVPTSDSVALNNHVKYDIDWIDSTTNGEIITAAAGVANLTRACARRDGKTVTIFYSFTLAASITVGSNGNVTDTVLGTVIPVFRPKGPSTLVSVIGFLAGITAGVQTDGDIVIFSTGSSSNVLSAGQAISLTATYVQ